MPNSIQSIVLSQKCGNCGIEIIDYGAPRYSPKSFLKNRVKYGKELPIASEEFARGATRILKNLIYTQQKSSSLVRVK